VLFGQTIRVGVRVSRLGNKSLDMEYQIEDAETGQIVAVGTTVLVAYSYETSLTIPIPDHWRGAILAFEQLETV